MGETLSVVQQIMKRKDSDLRNESEDRIDIDKPLWSQDTYFGRWIHYAFITDCRTVLVPTSKLWEAKKLCEDYKIGKEPEGLQRKDIIYAKKLRDSAFHPDNGEFMHVIGRMSFQLPSSVILTAAMLTFYRSASGVIVCQLVNQGFNAFVNYTNRNAMIDEPQDTDVNKQAFVLATAASCAAALGFRKLFSGRGTLFARFVPFCAVAVGNMVNLPIMRQREITRGIPIIIKNEDEACIMKSQVAAVKAISECVLTRIIMAAPGMLMIPMITQRMQPYCFYQLRPWIAFPVEIGLCTLSLLVMIPSALAIYPQKNSMKPELLKIYPEEYEIFREKMGQRKYPDYLYYNKGLFFSENGIFSIKALEWIKLAKVFVVSLDMAAYLSLTDVKKCECGALHSKCNVSNHVKELTKGLTLIVIIILLIMNTRFVSDPAERFATSASIETTTFTKDGITLI